MGCAVATGQCGVQGEVTLRGIGIDASKARTLRKGRGCSHCQGSGYRGRLGIYELMLVDDEIRKLILKNVDSGTLKARAREKGMRTLLEDGADKVLAGITTCEEVSRVTQEDSMSMDDFA